MELLEKILVLLSDLCGAEKDELDPDLNLFDEGLLDSFAVIQLLVELEEMFGIQLNIDEIPRERLATPRKTAELVQEALV